MPSYGYESYDYNYDSTYTPSADYNPDQHNTVQQSTDLTTGSGTY